MVDVVVTQSVELLCFAAQLFFADGAIDDLVVAAAHGAGGRDLVLANRRRRGVILDGNLFVGRVVAAAAGLIGLPADFGAGRGLRLVVDVVVTERVRVAVAIGIATDAGVRRVALLGAGRGGDGDCVDVLMRLRNVHAVPCCRWVFFRAPCRCRPAVFSFDKVERQAGNVEISIDALIV